MVGVPYTCNGPVNGVRVVGTGSDPRALVHLEAGCTGTLSFDIHVTSGGGDGVKVHAGAHDLTIGPSRIVCDRLVDTTFHQDGVQVQGGTNVTFNGLSIVCPYVTGQGAAGFYIDGKDFGGISNVVCDGCNLEHLHYGAMFTGPAPGSGVRNSVIHQGALTGGYFEKLGDPSRSAGQQQHARAALRRRRSALLSRRRSRKRLGVSPLCPADGGQTSRSPRTPPGRAASGRCTASCASSRRSRPAASSRSGSGCRPRSPDPRA